MKIFLTALIILGTFLPSLSLRIITPEDAPKYKNKVLSRADISMSK